MKFKQIILVSMLSLCFCFDGCDGAITPTNSSNISSISPKDTVDCLHIIYHIVWSSDYWKQFNEHNKNIHIADSSTVTYIDHITNGVVLIKITYRGNGPDSSYTNSKEFPISWLELDLNKEELRDITIDPEAPVQLKFDKTILPLIRRKCNNLN